VRGFHRELLTRAWLRGARLPNNPEACQRLIAASTAEWDEYWPKVKHLWREQDGELVNDDQLEAYRVASKHAEANLQRGQKATAKRQQPHDDERDVERQ
jgi:uncharacterized protein YdaU (DUF1376 family)